MASAVIILTSVCLQLLPHDLQLLVRYDRTGIQGGQLWRLLSGHLLHLSWNHLALNTAGLFLLAALFESDWRSKDLVYGGVCTALLISLGLYLFYPAMDWYVGLSGVLHGWFAIACIRLWSKHQGFAGLLFIALCAKLVIENTLAPGSDSAWLGGEVIEQAHLLGAGSGLLYVLCNHLLRRCLAKYA